MPRAEHDRIEVVPGRWYLDRMHLAVRLVETGHWLTVEPVLNEGRLVVAEATIGARRPGTSRPPKEDPGPVSAKALRAAISGLDHLRGHVIGLVVDPEGKSMWHQIKPENVERLKAAGPTMETLQVVADLYQVAYAAGSRPTKEVEERFRLSRSTAVRWVALARKKDLLGKAPTPGKAGI